MWIGPLQVLRNRTLLGILSATPLLGTDYSFGWADLALTAAPPFGHPADDSDASWRDEGSELRSVYKCGTVGSNDASEDPAGFPGDAFTCSCADSALGANATVQAAAGALTESDGVYVRDGIQCAWSFDGPAWTRVDFQSTVTSLNRKLESLVIESAGAAGAGACYQRPCDLVGAAPKINITVPIPARVVYTANSSRSLGSRPTGIGGRFSVSFQQKASTPKARQWKTDLKVAAGSARKGDAADATRQVGGPEDALAQESLVALQLSLTGAPGMETPCGFAQADQRLVLRLKRTQPVSTWLEGLWAGTSTAGVAADGAPLFRRVGSGLCEEEGALSQGNSGKLNVSDKEGCATQCIRLADCNFFSYINRLCLLFETCSTFSYVSKVGCNNNQDLSCVEGIYSTYQRQTELVAATCAADMIVQGISIRLFVHSCSNGTAASLGLRRSPETGMLHGLLQPLVDGTTCDISAAEQPQACIFYQNSLEDGLVEYRFWKGLVRWSTSSSNRGTGDVDEIMLHLGSGDAAHIQLFIAPLGLLPTPDLLLGAYSESNDFSNVKVFQLDVVDSNISNTDAQGPGNKDGAKVNLTTALDKCNRDLALIQSLPLHSKSTCGALAASLIFSTDILSEYPPGSTNISEICFNDCLSNFTLMINTAVMSCSTAWYSTAIPPANLHVADDGVPVLAGDSQLLAQFSNVLLLANALFFVSTLCSTNRIGRICSRGPELYLSGQCPLIQPLGYGANMRGMLTLIRADSCSTSYGNGTCASGANDYIYWEGCCAATISTALERWKRDALEHPQLAQWFRADWGNGSIQEFRLGQSCPGPLVLASAHARLPPLALSIVCFVGQCNNAGTWPNPCCNNARCANGKKEYEGACTCICTAGWTGAVCSVLSPHFLADLVLIGVTLRDWILGGETKFISVLSRTLIINSEAIEVNRAFEITGSRRGAAGLQVQFRVIGQTTLTAQRFAMTLSDVVTSLVFNNLLESAGLGSGELFLVASPTVYDEKGNLVCLRTCKDSNLTAQSVSQYPLPSNVFLIVISVLAAGFVVCLVSILAYLFRHTLMDRLSWCYGRNPFFDNAAKKRRKRPAQAHLVLLNELEAEMKASDGKKIHSQGQPSESLETFAERPPYMTLPMSQQVMPATINFTSLAPNVGNQKSKKIRVSSALGVRKSLGRLQDLNLTDILKNELFASAAFSAQSARDKEFSVVRHSVDIPLPEHSVASPSDKNGQLDLEFNKGDTLDNQGSNAAPLSSISVVSHSRTRLRVEAWKGKKQTTQPVLTRSAWAISASESQSLETDSLFPDDKKNDSSLGPSVPRSLTLEPGGAITSADLLGVQTPLQQLLARSGPSYPSVDHKGKDKEVDSEHNQYLIQKDMSSLQTTTDPASVLDGAYSESSGNAAYESRKNSDIIRRTLEFNDRSLELQTHPDSPVHHSYSTAQARRQFRFDAGVGWTGNSNAKTHHSISPGPALQQPGISAAAAWVPEASVVALPDLQGKHNRNQGADSLRVPVSFIPEGMPSLPLLQSSATQHGSWIIDSIQSEY